MIAELFVHYFFINHYKINVEKTVITASNCINGIPKTVGVENPFNAVPKYPQILFTSNTELIEAHNFYNIELFVAFQNKQNS